MNYWSTIMIDCFHEWHFLTTACTICLNQIHPRLNWLYGPVVTRSICQCFILILLRSLLFLDRCVVLFSFYVEVFVENACVCIRLIGLIVCTCSVHLIVCCVHCMLLGWSSRLSMWIKLILSYLSLLSPKADTHFTAPQRVEGWVDLAGWLHTEMVYPSTDGHPSWY